MKVLLAEDDIVPRHLLRASLIEWGYDVMEVENGLQAWQSLESPNAPPLALLDWSMPGLDGVTVCQKVRERQTTQPTYLILLTARGAKADIVTGLQCGANDYITKPFEREELRARILVGERVVELQASLAARVRELESALVQVNQLQALLPICAWCKSVRDDRNYWQKVEDYVTARWDAHFTHGICPDCLQKEIKLGKDKIALLKQKRESSPKEPPL